MLATHEQPLKTHVVTADKRMAGVPAVLRYRSDDPFAVRLAFLDVHPDRVVDGIEWVFARDLLRDGQHSPAGEGDVHIWPFGPSDLMIEVRGGGATALVITPQSAVRLFLCQIYAMVPAGAEPGHLDLDGGLARLVGQA